MTKFSSSLFCNLSHQASLCLMPLQTSNCQLLLVNRMHSVSPQTQSNQDSMNRYKWEYLQ